MATMSKRGIGTIWKAVRQRLRQRMPSGVVSPHYIFSKSEDVLFHLRLWWHGDPSLPKAIFLVLQIFLWLKWVLFYAWIFSWRVWRGHSADLASETGMSPVVQLARLMRLSLSKAILPSEIYKYGLLQNPKNVWEFVYEHETQTYHRLYNRQAAIPADRRALMSDKEAQTEYLNRFGIGVAPIIARVGAGDVFDVDDLISKYGPLFFKLQSGNQGRGAFSCENVDGQVIGRTLEGVVLADRAAVEKAMTDLLALGDAIILPFVSNHATLRGLSQQDDPTTIRLITRLDGDDVRCISGVLEVPFNNDNPASKMTYSILPISLSDGRVESGRRTTQLPCKALEANEAVLKRAEGPLHVPNWQELKQASITAHLQFKDYRMIAWDFIPAEEGPVLLEGNSGFGLATPQMMDGGFVVLERSGFNRSA